MVATRPGTYVRTRVPPLEIMLLVRTRVAMRPRPCMPHVLDALLVLLLPSDELVDGEGASRKGIHILDLQNATWHSPTDPR